MDIRKELIHEIENYTRLGIPPIMQKFVIVEGQEYTEAKHDFEMMEAKKCFQNAFQMATAHPRLTYCEGYAIDPNLGMLIHHAWCIDDTGFVVDVTWDKDHECYYYGIPFTDHELLKLVLKNEYYGVLHNGIHPDFDLIKDRAPKLWEDLVQNYPMLEGTKVA